jgi:hypothetical protein
MSHGSPLSCQAWRWRLCEGRRWFCDQCVPGIFTPAMGPHVAGNIILARVVAMRIEKSAFSSSYVVLPTRAIRGRQDVCHVSGEGVLSDAL